MDGLSLLGVAGAILWLALLIVDFIRPRRSRRALRWVAAGMLLMLFNMIARSFATQHHWSHRQLRILDVVSLGSSVVTLGCVVIGVIVLIRSGGWGRRQPNSAANTLDHPA